MKNSNTITASQNIEVYENKIWLLVDEYINTVLCIHQKDYDNIEKYKKDIANNRIDMFFYIADRIEKPSNNDIELLDSMGDIQKMVAVAEDNGFVVNKALTSLKMINYMRNNTAMQTAVLGAANKRLLTKQELANLLMQEYGITIDRCDEKFRFRKADGSLKTGRYFKEDVFTLYEADANGSFGTGLWGVTPEELEYRQFIQEENRSFVTLSMWATQDPVAVWTKASGMFVPVAPKANGGIVIGTKGE